METSRRSSVGSWIRGHRVIAAAIAIVLVVAAVLILAALRVRDPRIVYDDVSEEHGLALATFLDGREAPLLGSHDVLSRAAYRAEEKPTGFDLYVGLWGAALGAAVGDGAPLPEDSLAALPSSLRRIGETEGGRTALPVALDHVELLYRRDFFAEAGTLIDGRVRELAGLETVAAESVAPGFYPIIVAGGDDRALLDLVSVLTVSLGGVDAYRGVMDSLREMEIDTDNDVFAVVTPAGWEFATVSDRLRRWREAGLLHPEWTAFSEEDAFRFLESQRTVAVVMRLSTHRSWPPYALNRWRSSPFPYADPRLAGTGLVAPSYVVAIPADSPWREEAVATAPLLQGQAFQEEVVQAWRLAPVHSTAEALDRESADLRFWAAASRDILPSLADALPPEQTAAAAAAMRTVLTR